MSKSPPVEPPEKLTPMLRQYFEAKAQARDALLFFRLGDFYELFFEDARLASELLGITLTARSKGEDRVPMCGVPFHAAKGYIARLVAAGHKVAVCDQMEAPGPGKTLVRREIVRLVTPGTLVDDDLPAREPLLLAALAVSAEPRKGAASGRTAALALLDPSTGELRALPERPWAEALDELSRARPKELLVSESLAGTALATEARKASGCLRVEPRARMSKSRVGRWMTPMSPSAEPPVTTPSNRRPSPSRWRSKASMVGRGSMGVLRIG